MFDQQNDILDDETDEPSSSQTQIGDVEDALASFREQWQEELRISNSRNQAQNHLSSKSNSLSLHIKEEENIEEKAKTWYLKGAEFERAGVFYEAIQCYKKAVQLVPDVEFKICQKSAAHTESFQHVELPHDLDVHQEESGDDDLKEGPLLQHIQRKMTKNSLICSPAYEQRAMHISAIPTEILLYIFKWMVSTELDLRSLEVCAMVCRGFFVVARDSEIWRLACARVWDIGGGGSGLSTPPPPYRTWREMFVQRPRPLFNGCYISKTTYVRHGESSFQDQFYRPWHLVTYYRYLRFFPEGVVLMLTTPDEPRACVPQLRACTAKVALRGHYRLKDDRLVLVVQDHQRAASAKARCKTGSGGKWQHESGEQTFHLEFQIVAAGKRQHAQLAWKHYAIFIENRNGTVSKSSFDIANSRFPSLWFSRVKSYTKESLFPLV